MHNRSDSPWAAEFEAVRRQRGRSRSHGRHPFGPGWGGPMGGPPPWVAQMFGPQWAGPGGSRGGRGRSRVRRGDVRAAILDVLANSPEPLNGYQVIQQIAERSNGEWKPSPGSVYPTISQLQDEDLVEDAPEGRKTVRLTDEGRKHVEEHADRLATMWAAFDDADDGETSDLRQVIGQTVGAIIQVASTGTQDQRDKAVEILADTRRRLYGLLAEGPDDTDLDTDTEE
jgi:DNA-binding PadR family transcriptional regulator